LLDNAIKYCPKHRPSVSLDVHDGMAGKPCSTRVPDRAGTTHCLPQIRDEAVARTLNVKEPALV
jgi:hypothetical protein